jgi:hypothetical protein
MRKIASVIAVIDEQTRIRVASKECDEGNERETAA